MKTCSCCEKTKSINEFPKDPSHKCGLHSWCKSCVNQRQRERRSGIKRPKTYNMINRKAASRFTNGTHEKHCSKCDTWKPISQFNKGNQKHGDGYSYYCRLCRNAERREIGKRLRLEVLAAYGGKCQCCNESNAIFLTIDHTNNDGATHRKKIGGGGGQIYWWLKQNGYPKKGFQILCYNCNMGRAINNGICPHKQV